MIDGGEIEQPLASHDHKEGQAVSAWTCSMHPQIQQPGPGQCPICGMDLIPVSREDSGQLGYRELALSDRARKLAAVQVAPVERKFVSTKIRMVGKIEYDETRLGYITARVPGRIDRMYVDYTGIQVRKGDHLVELYSPDLLSTQQELIQTLKSVQNSGSELIKQSLTSIRERLRLWGLSKKQIEGIEKTRTISDHITIYAPMGGIVVHRDGLEGMYVNTGTRIYTIADLSRVWLKLDAYETDIPWIRYGQKVEFKTETFPGETFEGRISFIDPVLNEKTRTVKVRVIVENREGKLKPGMFANAVVHSEIAAGGRVMDPDLRGKWISPMHPEVIKDKPGLCDVCGMPLVRAEELGYSDVKDAQQQASLVIPASAPLITGKRAVVYVQVPGKEGVFEGREVILGPRAGDYYIVKDGLKEGEQVVVHGNFKIDSAIQILAKPSMMNPQGGVSSSAHQHHGEKAVQVTGTMQSLENKHDRFTDIPIPFLEKLDAVYSDYFEIQYAFSHDQLADANKRAQQLIQSLKKVDMSLLKGAAHDFWMNKLSVLLGSANDINVEKDIENARKAFEKLSDALIQITRQFGTSGKQPILLFHCPMAFDFKGADWLQNKEGTENPYFGSKMFTCGTQQADLTDGEQKHEGNRHE
jgi:Cu(I)/Ag(I) efflux system membrane fusion protein